MADAEKLFRKVLVAGRGAAAVRVLRACRELGVATVAVYAVTDRDALHLRLADEASVIGPAPLARSYHDGAALIEAARRTGCDALHPGAGPLALQAAFAEQCAAAGLVFIGPPADAIALVGSKIAAKQLAEQAGVPIAPGYMGADQSPERLRAEAQRIGFPLLVKASAGGGGKGMRAVRSLAELGEALAGARREAKAAFGDDAVFLERLIERPRHVEIQVLADQHGGCVHLFERECSIQRRHQKIVEEAPSVALTPELRERMGAAAVRLALAAGYVGAGTIEFMLDEPGRFYFLEMNTRLQVEHPVTELVSGLDLVHLQIAIAQGARLPFAQAGLAQRGHAIEVRVYAEDPATFLPSTGRVALFEPPQGPGLRNDVGLASGDEVTVNYDPMLAKLIVAAPDRAAAIERLRSALAGYTVLGVVTNLPLLRAIAGHPLFAAGGTTTSFLEEAGLLHVAGEPALPPPEVLVAAALADTLAAGECAREGAADPWQAGSWRGLGLAALLRYAAGEREHLVELARSRECWQARVGDRLYELELVTAGAHELIVRSEGQLLRFVLAREGASRLVGWQGASYRLERAAGLSLDALDARGHAPQGHASLAAPMPGTVVKVLAEAGQSVAAHQPLVVLEAMKMEHVVVAPYDGVIQAVRYQPGALVAKGAVLIELDQSADKQGI